MRRVVRMSGSHPLPAGYIRVQLGVQMRGYYTGSTTPAAIGSRYCSSIASPENTLLLGDERLPMPMSLLRALTRGRMSLGTAPR